MTILSKRVDHLIKFMFSSIWLFRQLLMILLLSVPVKCNFATPILMMILWRKGLTVWIFFYSLRNIGSWSKRRCVVTLALAACWSISDYDIDSQKNIATQNSYFQNISWLTIVVFKKILKPRIPTFKKGLELIMIIPKYFESH